jgi:hypothetical protein
VGDDGGGVVGFGAVGEDGDCEEEEVMWWFLLWVGGGCNENGVEDWSGVKKDGCPCASR